MRVLDVLALGLFAFAEACGASDAGGTAGPKDGAAGDAGSAGDASVGDADASGSGGAAGEAGSDADADASPEPEPGNALLLPDGTVTALYRTRAPTTSPRAIAFVESGSEVRALDEHGAELWKKDLGAGSLSGGFDFDADGTPDLLLARSADSGQSCGGQAMLDTWLDVARGKDGELFPLTAKLASICWTFGATTYPTPQWTVLDALFGAGTSTLFVAPYYATQGSYLAFDGSAFQDVGDLWYPSSPSYDSTYTADEPNAYGGPQSYTTNPHVANGFLLDQAGSERLVFFTSSRVVEYALGPLAADQLLFDTPFLTGNRTDLVGRDYGLVLRDPSFPDHVILVSGTDADSIYEDMLSASMSSDPWGQIERHVSIYDVATGSIEDRFFSYAHDNNDGNKYEGRVLYPANPLPTPKSGTPSRIAFDVYEGGHWMLHVTTPGTTSDAVVLKDMFLWDIVDFDHDGVDEWVLTPTRDPSDPDVPGYYYLKWRTVIAHFDASALALVDQNANAGVIPWIIPRFRENARTTSRGALYAVSTVRDASGLVMVTRAADGTRGSLPVAP